MRIVSTMVLAAIVSLGMGCATLKTAVTSIPTEPFTASLCATGAVPIPCTNLGTVKIPTGGQEIVSLVLAIAAPQLEKSANLKACLLTTYPASTAGVISITATATCKLNGATVNEALTVNLSPVAVAPPA